MDAGARHARTAFALLTANARYWTTVAWRVRRELRAWERAAAAIPSPSLRTEALAKLHEEDFNAQVAATLAVLAPRRLRGRAIVAIVALQVMYDYLDALTEQPVDDPIANGRALFAAFTDAVAPPPPASGPRPTCPQPDRVRSAALAGSQPGTVPADYYAFHPARADGGYLAALARTCRTAVAGLPAWPAVADAAAHAATRNAEAQTLTHAIPSAGADPLRTWALREASGSDLRWWELAAGAAASVLSLHALIAAACDPRTTPADAAALDAVYLSTCAISTLLDSLVDRERDLATGAHSYLSYYADEREATTRVATIAGAATSRAWSLPHGAHHAMTVAGVAGYYLSARAARTGAAAPITAGVVAELRPTIVPILAIFRVWRAAKAIRLTDT